MMRKSWSTILEFLLLFIITVPAFVILLNNQYFSMHDSQHIARLFLLDQGIRGGYLYPRWVSQLGFGYGYPLFNFYPPLIYYVAEVFHILGFSLVASIKLMLISGFVFSSFGIYMLIKNLIGRVPAFLGSVLYTYFFYHAINIYVRGAFAEFFSMAVLPFVFFALLKLLQKPGLQKSILFGITLALLILSHPLIAFPSLIFIGMTAVYYLFLSKNREVLIKYLLIGFITSLGLSAFFWIPSMIERKYTLVDEILTKNLANYKIHFVCGEQLWYSPWGYGGSIAGCADGMTFQLGKIQILFISLAIIAGLVVAMNKNTRKLLGDFFFFLFVLFFSLFMTVSQSSFIWDNAKFLWYLQFPWRFLTFTAVFVSIVGSYFIYFVDKKSRFLAILIVLISVPIVIAKYGQYFRPQKMLPFTDKQLTTYSEIAWAVSKTSFEFLPKGLRLMYDHNGAPILMDFIGRGISRGLYDVPRNWANIQIVKDKVLEKKFVIDAQKPFVFRANIFFFPGWRAYIDGKSIPIVPHSYLKLITVPISEGRHELILRFEDTPIRQLADWISILAFAVILSIGVYKLKKIKS